LDGFPEKVRYAHLFHLGLFLLTIPYLVLLITTSVRLFVKAGVASQLIGYLLIFIAISFCVVLISYKSEFRSTQDDNIKTGRLNLNLRTWDLSIPLIMYSKSLQSKINYWSSSRKLLSPFSVALGFYLSRTLEGDQDVFYRGFIVFLFGVLLLWNNTYQLAISVVLSDWGKVIGSPIRLLLPENPEVK
jgi:hypothetical protein